MTLRWVLKIFAWNQSNLNFNPLRPGCNKKVTHTETNLYLKAAGLFKYGWPFLLPPGIKGLKYIEVSV